MITLDIAILVLGCFITIISFWNSKRWHKIVGCTIGIILCVLGAIKIWQYEIEVQKRENSDNYYHSLIEQMTLRSKGELDAYIEQLGNNPILADSLRKIEQYCHRDDKMASKYFKSALSHPKFEDKRKRCLIMSLYGGCLGRLGKHKMALEYFQKAIDLMPRMADPYIDRSIYWKETKNHYKNALTNAEKAIETENENFWGYLLKGTIISLNIKSKDIYSFAHLSQLKMAEFRKAVEFYNLAIKYNPTFWTSYFYRGRAFQRLGQNDKAKRDNLIFLENVTSKNAPISIAHIRLAEIYSGEQNYCEALTHIDKAMELDSDYFNTHVMRGLILLQFHGVNESALEEFKKALVLEKNKDKNPMTYGGLAIAYTESGEYKKAITYIEKYFKDFDAANPITKFFVYSKAGLKESVKNINPFNFKGNLGVINLLDLSILRKVARLGGKENREMFKGSNFNYDPSKDEDALCIYRKMGLQKLVRYQCGLFVKHFMHSDKYEDAIKYLTIGVESCSTDDNCDKGPWFGNMASSLHEMGQLERAIEYGIRAYYEFVKNNEKEAIKKTIRLLQSDILALQESDPSYITKLFHENDFLKGVVKR